jgi:GntR family transcriptional regulator/MocR family aminotransferase
VQLEIPLSPGSGTIYRQTYLWLRRAIAVGHLQPGERLPSTRELASQLGISRTVTLLAYDQLLAEGLIEGRSGSGTYVSPGMTSRRESVAAPPAKLTLSRFGNDAAAAAPQAQPPGQRASPLRYDFSYGRSAVGEFPFEQWRRILMRKSRQSSARAFDYGPSAGSLALREAIAAHLRRSRAVVCDASQIIVVNGSQQALDLTARVLLEPGDRVAIEDPSYQGAREVFHASAAKLVPVPVDEQGLIPAKLPKSARLAFVTPSHQFPTGTVLPLARRLALLQWAKRTGAVVIEDDYDGEFRYQGQPVESMQGLDSEGRVLYIGTFSRTIFPALRIGYLVAPKQLAPALLAAKWLCDRHTATLEQETLAEFISLGAYERHLRRARRANAARRQALLDAIQKHIGDRASVTGAGSGTHLVLWPRHGPEETEIISRAATRGVGVYGISPYYLKPNTKPGLLLGFARLTEREIHEGIRQLAPILHR